LIDKWLFLAHFDNLLYNEKIKFLGKKKRRKKRARKFYTCKKEEKDKDRFG
jgi:hypothetical protein